MKRSKGSNGGQRESGRGREVKEKKEDDGNIFFTL